MIKSGVQVFLDSQGLGDLPGWIDELPRPTDRVALMKTAGNPLPATPWVDETAAYLTHLCRLEIERLDLGGAARADVEAVPERVELAFVTGGQPIYLGEHARRGGSIQAAGEAVPSDRLAYAGLPRDDQRNDRSPADTSFSPSLGGWRPERSISRRLGGCPGPARRGFAAGRRMSGHEMRFVAA